MGIEPTTAGLDLPSLCRLSYKVACVPSVCAHCVPSATRHNIHMYPYFPFAAIHHLKSSPTFSVRPCSSVGRVTEDLIRRSWVRFPPKSKDFFFASCGSLFPLTRANAQWVISDFHITHNAFGFPHKILHKLLSSILKCI